MTTTNTVTVTVATTSLAVRFAKTEAWMARQEACVLYRIVVDTMNTETIDTGRVSRLLSLASRLSGIAFDDLWNGATECAAAERLQEQRLWENRRGIAQHPREAFSIPTPKHNAVERALRC